MTLSLLKFLALACGTLIFPVLVWYFTPKIFRKLHSALQDSLQLLPRSSTRLPDSYDKSLWALMGLHEDKRMTLDKLSSLGLILLGVMGMAEALDLPTQSIMTFCGIGGLATIFVTKDIFSNLLSGLHLQFSKPFGVGDSIKVGSVEGQVVEMGVTTTSLINPKKSFMIVPNSFFSNQVIVNESRAQLCASLIKLPVRIKDIEKIPLISEGIKTMLEGHPKVFLGRDAPYCYLSRIEDSFAEFALGWNLESMRKDELFSAEQDILLQAARIIRGHGAALGSSLNNRTNF